MQIHRLLSVLLVGAIGCASLTRVENQPLAKFQPGSGYGARPAETPYDTELRVVLAFSGGGIRAAALAYGVLKQLRDTEIVLDGRQLRLLDAVSAISSVSGGSFASAYYGLYGERIFEDFEERVLRRDFDAGLAFGLLQPIDLFRYWFTKYTRSDMAIDLYDREVFDGATFADLGKKGGPLLNINATDIDVGAVFTFIQPVFDLICADLSQLRLATAVTASSAVPGVFAPLVIENRAGTCERPEPAWIREALANPTADRRTYHNARTAATYLDREQRPYIFLVDGGVADNIGARRLIEDVVHMVLDDRGRIAIPKRVLYVVVNAQAGGRHDWDRKLSLPSLTSVLSSISNVGIYRYNFETIELLREETTRWSEQAAKHGRTLETNVVEVAFDDLADPAEREFFNDVATSMDLDDETVDRLIAVGGRLLSQSNDFRDFLASVNGPH